MPGSEIVWWGHIKSSKAKIRRARLGKGGGGGGKYVSPEPARVFRISSYWSTFHSYLGAWNRLGHAILVLYWCTVLVHKYGRRKSSKTSGVRELVYVRINTSSNTWNGYTAENQEERLFFNEAAFLFWCHAMWKLESSNCCIFEMKHATGMETCAKIHFFVYR